MYSLRLRGGYVNMRLALYFFGEEKTVAAAEGAIWVFQCLSLVGFTREIDQVFFITKRSAGKIGGLTPVITVFPLLLGWRG